MTSLLPPQPPPPPPPSNNHYHPNHIFVILTISIASITLLISLSSLFFLLYRKLSRNKTTPSDNHQNNPHRFSFSLLRRSTASFSPSNRLGHGGFGSVYKATLPSGQSVAVKVMNSNSLQGEREFQNELSICSSLSNPHIVTLLGYSTDKHHRRRRRCNNNNRLVLVYELMANRSLQDALFYSKCRELMDWRKRFGICLQVGLALEYLHHFCNPAVIHGDVKPSNVLLDADFCAKIGDFGLARFKNEDEGEDVGGDNGSILEETLTNGFEENASEGAVVVVIDDRLPPDSCVVTVLDSEAEAEMAVGNFDKISIESGNGNEKDLVGRKKGGNGNGRDWWWKQENGNDGGESGRVKDYVMEWIGNEIKKEDRPKSEWVVESSRGVVDDDEDVSSSVKVEKQRKQRKRRLEWWASLDEGRIKKKEKNRKPREWWKEEFCEELTKKKKKKELISSSSSFSCRDLWWQRDDEDLEKEEKKKNKKSSKGSIDWWLDGLSGDLRNGRRNSQDGDIPKSGGISSTPSMRGTVCYTAPECGGGQISEKCDVYSFGVLLLVLVSGRRPLQVTTTSPMSEFERANLISWARQLARNGKLLDLIDPSIHSLDKEQALLCITIALLCLQRTPSKRPTMKEIVAVLSGEAEPPHLPFEFSPSPPSDFLFKSQRKGR